MINYQFLDVEEWLFFFSDALQNDPAALPGSSTVLVPFSLSLYVLS